LELFSAISRKIREGNIDHKDGSRIIAKFLAHLDDLFYARLPIESQHYTLARDWIGRFTSPLRSLDAIHLNVASSSGSTLISADEGLAKSAELLSVDVYLIK
jgi:predicted nucleic acid-binding protein